MSNYSHPDQSVRHSYPLSTTNDGLMTAVGLLIKTAPYVLARLGILVGFTIATIIWFGVIVAISSLFGDAGGGVGVFALIIGFGVPFGLFQWARKYVLYILKAGHIAVLTELIVHGKLKDETNQVKYGKDIVTARFGEVNVMFVLDSLIGGVVKSFNRTLNWIADLLPIPGLESIVGVAGKIVDKATTYIDETIFSYNLARGDENVWRSSQEGLVYYAQNWKPVLKTAVYALLLQYALNVVLFICCLGPAYLVGAIMPSIGGWAVVFAVLFALNISSAVLHPLFLTMVALTFHRTVQNQAINPELDKTLGSVSEKFRDLAQRAKAWIDEKRGQGKVGHGVGQGAGAETNLAV